MEKTYKSTLISLYFNYILQGMAVIILAQNMTPLTLQLNTNTMGISSIIACIGLGRIIILFFAGHLSDRIGRKRIVMMGIVSYMIFFLGILASSTVLMAMFFTLFAGFGNAFLDTGTYPALQETMPSIANSSSVLNKAFISVGQFSLPIIVSFLIVNNLYYGYAFIFCFLLLVFNFFYLKTRKFRPQNIDSKDPEIVASNVQANFKIEGIALILFAFTTAATFNIITLWLPEYAMQIADMPKTNALMLVSIYSIGSFISVFTTALLVKKFPHPTMFMVIYSFMAMLVIVMLIIAPSQNICRISAFLVGVFAAGGIWQLGLSKLLSWFPIRRGRITSYYSFLASLSVLVIPLVSGYLASIDIRFVIYFNLLIAMISFALTIIVFYRNRKLEAMTCVTF